MQTHLQRPPSKTLQYDQTFSHTIHHHILTVILLSQNPGWWKERPWSVPILASFTLNHQIVRIVGKPTCTISVSKHIACKISISKPTCTMSIIAAASMLEKTSEWGCQSTFTFQYLLLKKPSGCQLIGETRNNWDTRTDWLLAETRTNQLMVVCNSYHHQSCNTKISIILWGVWGLCNSHHHQRRQYKKINHPLGFVMFMQLSSSSKTAIQKKSIILWGLWGLCTTLIIKDCNTKKSVILWGLWGLCKGG